MNLSNITTFIDKSVLTEIPTKKSSNGESSNGESSNGESSNGESSNGESSNGESSNGESSNGESSNIIGGFLNKLENRQKSVQYYKLKNSNFFFDCNNI